jgi:hypothetical protein
VLQTVTLSGVTVAAIVLTLLAFRLRPAMAGEMPQRPLTGSLR